MAQLKQRLNTPVTPFHRPPILAALEPPLQAPKPALQHLLCAPTLQTSLLFLQPKLCRLHPDLPYTTQLYHQWKQQEEEKTGLKKKDLHKKDQRNRMQTVQRERDPATHQHYFGNWYCQATATMSLAEWRAALIAQGQLHTPTNLILLSLAVSDFLVGALLMPLQILQLGGCWFLGTFICGLFYFSSFILTSASVGNMVLISVDRYMAICDPLRYPARVTLKRVQFCVCLCWACSVLYNGVILMDFLKQPDRYNSCHGECIVVVNYIFGAIDVLLTFAGPLAVIIVLYMRVFVVAVSQARAMHSQTAAVKLQGSVCVTAQKSERKAARTLGIIVAIFIICFCPYFYPSLAGQDMSTSVAFSIFGIWLLYCNSCLNPIVYAFFYPWFRKSIKLIVTFKMWQHNSHEVNIM
ncbi:uncharacterized protein V6R79_013765 [Siganus canaliculatus]